MKATAWSRIGLTCLTALAVLIGAAGPEGMPVGSAQAAARTATAPAEGRIVAMRRLTEQQYRNSIADIFGPDIAVSGRFDPIERPLHQLIAAGARTATVSAAGMEQYDAMGRAIAAQVFDEAHRPVFVRCKPRDQSQADGACAGETLARLGRYVFRRPLTESERAEYVRIADKAAAVNGFYGGLGLALGAMLVSPSFLYVIETSEPDPRNPGTERLDDYSRAARLSYLLWNTTPGEDLLQAAAQGRLTDEGQLRRIAAGMAASPRLESGVRAFFADMLLFEKFDDMTKDTVVYPRFSRDVGKALSEQMMRTIVDHLVTRRQDYRSLFTTRTTFINRALGPLYQTPVQASQGWIRYETKAEEGRAGLLGQAGFLALYSHSGRSSPTLRGRAIRETLLCQPVPDPPGNVDFVAVNDVNSKTLPTAKVRLAAHNDNPVCAGCHKITDTIGLPLEHFDGIGAFRPNENGAKIDAGGAMDGNRFDGLAGLGQALAGSEAATSCLASRMLEYATGESAEHRPEVLEAVEKGFARDGYMLPQLMLRIATDPQLYRVPTPPLAPVQQHTLLTAPPSLAFRHPQAGVRP